MVKVQPGHRLISKVNCVLFNVPYKPQLSVMAFFFVLTAGIPFYWDNLSYTQNDLHPCTTWDKIIWEDGAVRDGRTLSGHKKIKLSCFFFQKKAEAGLEKK